METNKKITELKNALVMLKTERKHLVGKMNDILLKEILLEIREKPTLGNFVMFVNCLNFFYSTRLQAAKGDRDEIIIKVAQLLKSNWRNGIKLFEEIQGGECNLKKIDLLRDQMFITLNRHAYSFSTKVFHHLNNLYPILDLNVRTYMKNEFYQFHKSSFYTKPYDFFYLKYMEMVNQLKWPKNKIDELDVAIWITVNNNRKKYFPKKTKVAEEELLIKK